MNSIHNPTITVSLCEGTIEIRELSWPDAMELYKRLKDQLQRYLSENGNIKLDAATIVAAITENIELGMWLVERSTRKDRDWINQRSLSEVLDIAMEAAVLNVEILVARIKNGGSRLRASVAGANMIQKLNSPDSTRDSQTKPSS